MATGFERFSESARKVLTRAQGAAQRLGHNYIDTEHLLLGLAQQESGVASKVLANLGIPANKVQPAVEFLIGKGQKSSTTEEVGLAPGQRRSSNSLLMRHVALMLAI